ncbi:SMC family ATPase [Paenibacillus sp. CC-CFT747]|nr:SMC family ATPase [Paenibacillus sp. CC-CFT747]
MKPISLTLSGLQSYREKQEIDFTALCGAGVFGIFGPTGSGKSSILDAMTLALYGKVERASGGTQGIMNHAENTLSVAFVFELSHAGGPLRFKVERQFKRGGEVSVNNTVSRFIRYEGEEPVVMADKVADVNQKVQQVLGLSMTDFTRAVVLPQGKFAEFLALGGKERRQMLQRLFHLEPYGDLLNARVSTRFKETDLAVKQLAAEQQGLGDASEAALETAKARLEEAAASAKDARERRLETERGWEERRQLRAWLQEEQALAARLREHAEREPHVRQRESELRQAEQAERVRPVLEAREAAEQHYASCREQSEGLEQRLAELRVRQEAARAAHAAAKEQLTAQDAPLQVRLEQLAQAQELESELARLTARIRSLEAERAGRALQLQAAGEKLLKEQELHRKATSKQAEIKESLRLVEVKASDRERIHKLSRLGQELDSLEKGFRDVQAETEAADRQLKAYQEEETGKGASLEEASRATGPILLSASEAAAGVQEAESRIHLLQRQAAAGREKLAKLSLEQERNVLALSLSSGLTEGEPCPVCGSSHHPSPAGRETSAASVSVQDEIGRLDKLTASFQQSLFSLSRHKFSLEQLVERAGEAFGAGEAGREAASAAVLEKGTGPDGATSPRVGASDVPVDRIEADFRECLELLERTEAKLPALDKELRQRMEERSRLVKELDALAARRQAAETVLHSLQVKRNAAEQAVKEVLSRWQREADGLSREDAYQEAARLMERDKQADELKQKLEVSVPFIEGKVESIQRLQQETAVLEKEQVQLETEGKGLQNLAAEKKAQLTARTGGGTQPLDRQIAETKEKLEQLRSAEHNSREELEKSEALLLEWSHRCTAAKQACESAAAARETAEARWKEAALRSGFADADAVRRAWLTEETVQRWKEELVKYRELEAQLKGKREELTGLLAGRTLGEDEWKEWEHALQTVRRVDEEALAAKARTERDWDDLQVKHAQWKKLEDQKKNVRSVSSS